MMIAGHAPIATSALVKTGPGSLIAAHLAAPTADSTLILYDNTSATGTVLATLAAAAKGADDFCPGAGIAFSIGCYAAISGSGAAGTVVYL